jgi:hypothetical protein
LFIFERLPFTPEPFNLLINADRETIYYMPIFFLPLAFQI